MGNGCSVMKAIPMAAEPCLVCHGGNLAPDLTTEIEKLSPERSGHRIQARRTARRVYRHREARLKVG